MIHSQHNDCTYLFCIVIHGGALLSFDCSPRRQLGLYDYDPWKWTAAFSRVTVRERREVGCWLHLVDWWLWQPDPGGVGRVLGVGSAAPTQQDSFCSTLRRILQTPGGQVGWRPGLLYVALVPVRPASYLISFCSVAAGFRWSMRLWTDPVSCAATSPWWLDV